MIEMRDTRDHSIGIILEGDAIGNRILNNLIELWTRKKFPSGIFGRVYNAKGSLALNPYSVLFDDGIYIQSARNDAIYLTSILHLSVEDYTRRMT